MCERASFGISVWSFFKQNLYWKKKTNHELYTELSCECFFCMSNDMVNIEKKYMNFFIQKLVLHHLHHFDAWKSALIVHT